MKTRIAITLPASSPPGALIAALFLVACGRDGLNTADAGLTPPRVGRVRLAVTGDANSGFRFEDETRVWSRLTWASNLATEEVRDDDGRLLTGAAQRSDLRYQLGRYTHLAVQGDNLCVLTKVASLDEVDAAACTGWKSLHLLQLLSTPGVVEDFSGLGLVVRSPTRTFRLRVVENGWDQARQEDFVTLDFAEDAVPRTWAPAACVADGGWCQRGDGCCGAAASCVAERCVP